MIYNSGAQWARPSREKMDDKSIKKVQSQGSASAYARNKWKSGENFA